MSDCDINFSSLKNINIEQLFKIIQLQSEQIESQKSQINALIKCQQTLLEGMYQNRPSDNREQIKSLLCPQVSQRNVQTNCSSNNNMSFRPDCNSFEMSGVTPRLSMPRKTQHVVSDSFPILDGTETIHLDANDSDPHEKSFRVKKEAANKFQENCINIGGAHSNEIELNDDEEDLNLSSLQEFASKFKVRRIELGFTQRDVGVCLGLMQGNDFSQTTLSRFEALNLSYRNMRKLQPLLQRWLDAIDHEGRDVVMARVSAFYQQQRSIVEDESENTDALFLSGQCRKRVNLESQDVPEKLPDDYHRVTADSTTMHIKSSYTNLTRSGHVVPNAALPRPDPVPISAHPSSLHSLMASTCFSSPLVTTDAISTRPLFFSDQTATATNHSHTNNVVNKKRRRKSKISDEMIQRLEGVLDIQKQQQQQQYANQTM